MRNNYYQLHLLRFLSSLCLLTGGFPSFPANSVAPQPDAETEWYQMDEMIVTANRYWRLDSQIGKPTVIITSEQIARSMAHQVPDVLRSVAGLQVADLTGNGRKTTIDIRGYGETAIANTLVVVDGRRINGLDLSGVDWSTIPLEQIERIEITRGGNSVLYGDKAVGGVINIITKKGTGRRQLELAINGGSFQQTQDSLRYTDRIGRLKYSLAGDYFYINGFRDNSYLRNKTGSLNLNYTDSIWFFDFAGGAKDDRYGLPGSLPESAAPTRSNSPDNYASTDEIFLHFTPGIHVSDNDQLKLTLDFRQSRQFSDFVNFNIRSESTIKEYGISPQYDVELPWYSDRYQHLTIGSDYFYSSLWNERIPNQNDARESWGIYLQDNIPLAGDRWFLDLGYRREYIAYDFDRIHDESHWLDAMTTSLNWNYQGSSKLFISMSRDFRTQLLDELGGAAFDRALPPQIAKTIQTGVAHSLTDTFRMGVTVFQIDTDKEIFFDPNFLTPGALFPGQNVNYKHTRRQGIEMDMTHEPCRQLRLFGAMTWLDPQLTGGIYDGNEIPGVARKRASLGITWLPIDKLSVDLYSIWSDDSHQLTDWNNEIAWDDSYVVTNLKIAIRIDMLTLSFGVNNLFDIDYAESGVYNPFVGPEIYPSPGRNWLAGIKISKAF